MTFVELHMLPRASSETKTGFRNANKSNAVACGLLRSFSGVNGLGVT